MKRFLLIPLLRGSAAPALAHEGPPFPILVDQRVGPYVASVWTDPDIGTGTFFVILEPPEGKELPGGTAVRIAVEPLDKHVEETLYKAEPQAVRARVDAVLGVLAPLSAVIDDWHVASLDSPRGATAQQLAASLTALGVTALHSHDDVAAACRAAQRSAGAGDRVLVFGSFHTVEQALRSHLLPAEAPPATL